MIRTKDELKDCLALERSICFKEVHNSALYAYLACSKYWLIWQYLKSLRLSEYHKNNNHKLRFAWYHRRKHKLGRKTGFEIPENTIEPGITIYHLAPIVLCDSCHIGKNFRISGGLCIAMKSDDIPGPTIGDNVWAGYGACVVGDVHVADNVILGASCVVTKDILEPGAKVAGIPAQIVG